MKQSRALGPQYLQELGIRPAKNKDGIARQLRETLGAQTGGAIWRQIEGAETPEALYQSKNQTLAAALTFSGAYDSDIYSKAFAWIEDNRHRFGAEILEVGCDCGIVSCFLARMFPEAAITAIDRTPAAVAAARQLADRMGVGNVTFLQRDLGQLEGRQYDTVFSMRTVHENIADRQIAPSFALLLEQAMLYGNAVADYAELLIGKVKPGGNLVTIEKGEKNPMFLGWLLDLHANELRLQAESYRELRCTVLGQPQFFQAISAVKGEHAADNVYGFWCSLFPPQTDAYQFEGWEAETVLQNTAPAFDRLLEGFYLCDGQGQRCGKYGVWTLRHDPRALVYYQGSAERTTVGFYDRELLLAIRQQLAKVKAQAAAQRLTVQRMD